jgi:3-methyladenine DNA glycosylase AlkD
MTTAQVLAELKKAGKENIKKIFMKHGGTEPIYGVKVEDMKQIQKKIRTDTQTIAKELFGSGVGDAQYLAGLMANGAEMTKQELDTWAKTATWSMASEYAVPWVTAEHPDAISIALKWIDSKNARVATSGWTTLGAVASTWPDEKLDMALFKKLIARVENEIFKAPNRVRYCMNGFVITVGSYCKELTASAISTGKKIGTVEVDMGDTSCKVPFAPDYINKVLTRNGGVAKKKKTAKC